MPNSKQLRIVCAAIKSRVTGQVVAGARHFDRAMKAQIAAYAGDDGPAPGGEWWKPEQGFLTNQAEFLTREQAWEVATEAGQIRREDYRPEPRTDKKLRSEDLY
jgi:hypothetical protein